MANALNEKRTSVSDNHGFPDFCRRATEDEEVFKTFKINPRCNIMGENHSYKAGKKYLKVIEFQTPELINYFDKFRENDKYGQPRVYDYGKYGIFSPSTVEYIKVLSDFKKIFGDLNGKNIIEIGGGYGGQCKIILDYFRVNSYTIVDLKPTLDLAKKYLGKFGVKDVIFLTSNDLSNNNRKYDLVISNFAFSECARFIQDLYFEKVIRNSSGGYIAWDFYIKDTDLYTYSVKEFIKKMRKTGIILRLLKIPLPLYSFIFFWNKSDKSFSLSQFITIGRIKSALSNFLPHIYSKLLCLLKEKFVILYRLLLPIKKWLNRHKPL